MLIQSLQFKMNRFSSYAYHAFLEKLALEGKVDLSQYPIFTKYLSFIKAVHELKEPVLFQELDSLENKIRSAYAQSNEARSLMGLERRLRIVDDLLRMRITNQDFDELSSHQSEYGLDGLMGPFRKLSESFEIGLLISGLDDLDRVVDLYRRFYSKVLERDQIMFDNAWSEIEKRDAKTTVIVTGGFHTRGISERLREKGVSFFVITPKVTHPGLETPYFSILLNELPPLDRWLVQGTAAGVLQRPLLTSEAPIVWPEHKAGLLKLFNLLYPAAEFLDESKGKGPDQRVDLQLARLRLVNELAGLQGRLGEGVQDFHVDYMNLRQVSEDGSVVELPVIYRVNGKLQRSVVLLSRGNKAPAQIQSLARARALSSNEVSGALESSSLGTLSYAVYQGSDQVQNAQSAMRDEILSGLLESEGLSREKANNLVSQLLLSSVSLSNFSQALKGVDIAVDSKDINKMKRYIDALYEAAVSEADYDLVARLYSELNEEIKKAPGGQFKDLHLDLRNRLRIASHAKLMHQEKAALVASLYDQDFDSDKAFAMSTSLFVDIRVDDQGNMIATPKESAGEAVAFLKNIFAAARSARAGGQTGKVRLAFVDLHREITPAGYQVLLGAMTQLLGIPSQTSPGNPVLMIGIEEVVRRLESEVGADKARDPNVITTAIRDEVSRKTGIDASGVSVIADEKELRGRMEAGIAAYFIKAQDGERPPVVVKLNTSALPGTVIFLITILPSFVFVKVQIGFCPGVRLNETPFGIEVIETSVHVTFVRLHPETGTSVKLYNPPLAFVNTKGALASVRLVVPDFGPLSTKENT